MPNKQNDYFSTSEQSKQNRSITAYLHAIREANEMNTTGDYYEMAYEYEGSAYLYEDAAYYNFDLEKLKQEITQIFNTHDKTFAETVMEIIRTKNLDEIAVYKRAHLDRKLFSKLRSNIYYKPSRHTAIALVLALELEMPEAQELLRRAGFALSNNTLEDIIVEYFIKHHIYSILALNEVFYAFSLPLLGE